MRQIQPINIWSGGQQKSANTLNMYIINDNLTTSATFYYQLLTVANGETSGEILADGNLIIEGQDYESWGEGGDINLEAYTWAALQLNLILI